MDDIFDFQNIQYYLLYIFFRLEHFPKNINPKICCTYFFYLFLFEYHNISALNGTNIFYLFFFLYPALKIWQKPSLYNWNPLQILTWRWGVPQRPQNQSRSSYKNIAIKGLPRVCLNFVMKLKKNEQYELIFIISEFLYIFNRNKHSQISRQTLGY